jgi:hypothetical protein
MARQHGNSGRGPDDLDRAERNLGRSGSRRDNVPAGEVPGAHASEFETQDTGQLLADGELVEEVAPWSASDAGSDEEEASAEASDEESVEASDDDMNDRSMRAHGSDKAAADGQHGLSGGSNEPGSGPRHR